MPQVAGKRWRVDLGSKGEAVLLLSAVNLPGGVQRRRTAEDELSMRSIFQEGDVISVRHIGGGRAPCVLSRRPGFPASWAARLLPQMQVCW